MHRRQAYGDAAARDATPQSTLWAGDDVRRRRHGRGRYLRKPELNFVVTGATLMATPATHPKTTVKAAAGGSFLLEERTPQEVFTPEDFNDEQRQIAETATNFAQKEI